MSNPKQTSMEQFVRQQLAADIIDVKSAIAMLTILYIQKRDQIS